MSEIKVNSIVDASGGSTVQVNGFTPTVSNMAGRNRIINGDMRIDQRNAGAAVANPNGYTVDRWYVLQVPDGKLSFQQNAGAVTPPTGFYNYAGVTSSSAYSVGSGDVFGIFQRIEGFNTSDLAWGTANAKAITVSFWVRSSLTGTFGGAIQNNAQDRSYPFTYSISSVNTWEQKTVVISGDTTGTWLTTNGVGLGLYFGLGAGSTYSGTAGAWTGTNVWQPTGSVSVVGTSGATFYITGVQLEEGSVATPFEYRQYGQELALCQRYFYKATVFNASTTANWLGYYGGSAGVYELSYPVPMRTTPTATLSQPTQVQVYNTSGWTNVTVGVYAYSQERSLGVYVPSDHSWGKLLQLSGGSTVPTASLSAEL